MAHMLLLLPSPSLCQFALGNSWMVIGEILLAEKGSVLQILGVCACVLVHA